MNARYYRKVARTTKPKNISNRPTIYFSGRLLKAKDFEKEQRYLKTKKRNKPLYVFELSSISSRYIGETEKNLNSILDKLRNMNGILFFDEADALFGKKSSVKDSHDRYANVDTNYLLERIEKYRGIMFVTSNFKKPVTKRHITKLDYVLCMPIKKRE